MAKGLRFTLSQEPVCTYSLPCDTRLWGLVLEAAEGFEAMDEEEQGEAIDYAKGAGFTPLFPE